MRYIETLKDGERISEVYLCKSKSIALTKTGKEYANVMLADKTGQIDSKIWDLNSGGIAEFDVNDYVAVTGQVTSYNGALQFKIERARIASENEYVAADYVPSSRYNIDNIQVFEFITKQADINNQACNDYILDYYKHFILKPNAISNGIVDKVFKYIAIKTNLSNNEIDELIKDEAIKANKSVDDYMLDYYNNVILKDNKNNSVIIEDINKVNFEELTETDKKVIASRKYMCHEYVKEIVYKLNELINKDLSNDRRAVDEAGVVMYAIQAIDRDVANAVSDCQKVLKLMKSKCS